MEPVHSILVNQQPNAVTAFPGAPKTKVYDRASLRKLWDEEYANVPTIPSSHRSAPAHALVELGRCFDFRGQKALDLGCGNGRNAVYFASKGMHVTAVDFSEAALLILKNNIASRKYTSEIEIVNHDLYDSFPFDDASFDLVLDSYCLCHFVDRERNSSAMQECRRVLKPGGHLIKIHLDSRDAYYLERVYEKTEFGHISLDPVNGLKKMHCDVESYAHIFADPLSLEMSLNINFIDNVRGKEYERSIFVSVMKKS